MTRLHPRQIAQAAATAGQILTWNGTAWAPDDASGGGGGGGGTAYPLGSADEPPGSPSAYDDEFDGTTSVTWTAFGSPASNTVNSTRPGHLYLQASGTGSTLVGRVQTAPASFPFTVSTKVAGTTSRANYHRGGGLCFFPSGAISGGSSPVYFGVNHNAGARVARITYSGLSGYGGEAYEALGAKLAPVYLRAVFTSATAVSLQWSHDGWAWQVVEAPTLPFSVGQIGLACSEEGGGGLDVYFDWLRVT